MEYTEKIRFRRDKTGGNSQKISCNKQEKFSAIKRAKAVKISYDKTRGNTQNKSYRKSGDIGEIKKEYIRKLILKTTAVLALAVKTI